MTKSNQGASLHHCIRVKIKIKAKAKVKVNINIKRQQLMSRYQDIKSQAHAHQDQVLHFFFVDAAYKGDASMAMTMTNHHPLEPLTLTSPSPAFGDNNHHKDQEMN